MAENSEKGTIQNVIVKKNSQSTTTSIQPKVSSVTSQPQQTGHRFIDTARRDFRYISVYTNILSKDLSVREALLIIIMNLLAFFIKRIL